MAIIKRVEKGTTDVSVVIQIIDSATGVPETAVEHNTSGIDLWYRREGAAKTSITEAALSALTDAHSDGGIEAIGNGAYRLDLPDAACASGVATVEVGGTITDMIVIGGTIELAEAGVLSPSSTLFVDFGGVPSVLVTPKTGTDTFDMRFESRDHNNQLVAPDSVTVTLVDQDGTDLSSRLDDTTPSAVSTGLYEVVYTATAADAAAQLKLGVTLTKSGYVGDKQHYSINLVSAPSLLATLDAVNLTTSNGNIDVDVAVQS